MKHINLPRLQLLSVYAYGPPVAFQFFALHPPTSHQHIIFRIPPALIGTSNFEYFLKFEDSCSQYDIDATLHYLNTLSPSIWQDDKISSRFPPHTKPITSIGAPPPLPTPSITMTMWPELYLSYLYVYEASFTIWTPPEFPEILQFFSLPTPQSIPLPTPFEPSGPQADWHYYLYWRLECEEAPRNPEDRVSRWSELLASTLRSYYGKTSIPNPDPIPTRTQSIEPAPFDPTSIVDAICAEQPSSSSDVVDVDAIMTEPEEPSQHSASPPTVVATSRDRSRVCFCFVNDLIFFFE